MTNNDFTVYDTVTPDQLEVGDNVAFMPPGNVVQEVMTLVHIVDEGDSILITGDSYQSGDRETYILTADHQVDLWTV